ncbi:transposase DDE domain protein [Leptospira noguchii str. 1993005606]|nr:transposase DDE domain protein [Leptospira noguchii str. 1993005606]
MHLIINDRGEILSFMKPRNVRRNESDFHLLKIFTINFSEIGLHSQSLFESLYEKGIQLITKLKKEYEE